jgi:1,4-alpha-glucan branching enzyme
VHGKGSLLGRIKGDFWQRCATLRAYYAFMWAHPGKKLLFMGQEFAQENEWNFSTDLDWHLLDFPAQRGVQNCVRDLNRLYRSNPALHARDCEAEGFRWIVPDDAAQSVYAWLRFAGPDEPPIAVVCNFTPIPRHGYRLGLPKPGIWREILNTDAECYGGSNLGNFGAVMATDLLPSHGLPASTTLLIPPLATLYFRFEAD